MNYYHIWCNLSGRLSDVEFAKAVDAYLGALKQRGTVESFKLSRRKLGFGPPELGEFHIVIETRDLEQLDRAFDVAAAREGEVESLHARVYSAVKDFRSGLFRDFPDPVRKTN